MKSTTKERLKLNQHINNYPDLITLNQFLKEECNKNTDLLEEVIELNDKTRQQSWRISELEQMKRIYGNIAATCLVAIASAFIWNLTK